METENEKIASTVLAEVYKDFQRERRYRSMGRWIYFFFFIFIIISLINSINENPLLASGGKKAGALEESFVPVIEIFGSIDEKSNNHNSVNKLLEEAFEMKNSPGIILHIDSPGGLPYECLEVVHKIRTLKKKYPEKKLIAQVGSMAASGGYYIAAAADKIYASELSSVGSIGVVTFFTQYNRFLEEYKIIPCFYHAGKNKVGINPFKEPTAEDEAKLQEHLTYIHKNFIQSVKDGRKDRLNADDETLFNADIWFGPESKSLGLIDEIGFFDEMFSAEFGDDIKSKVILEDIELDFKKLLMTAPSLKLEGLDLNAKTLLQWNGS